jgi:2,3-dihydroxy-2,3-dihydrophenylpropionate dehydrogenase
MTGESGTGQVAVVTGGSSGIGLAVVRDLAGHGYQVTVLDQCPPASPFPPATTLITGDVRSFADNERAVAAAMDRHGRLDLLVGNAGIHDAGTGLRDVDGTVLAALTRRVFDVNVLGYLLAARAAVDALTCTAGSMVFTLSDASFMVQGNGAGVAYVAAKHAALGLVRQLAADLAPTVRVNGVAPGGVVTGLRAAVGAAGSQPVFDRPEPIIQAIRGLNPLGVVLTPEQLAPLYRFLAGPDAAGMTGEVLRPDGGLSVR